MRYFKRFNSGSVDHNQEESLTSITIESKPDVVTKKEVVRSDKRLDSSDNRTSACYFMYSGSAMPDKPAILQEAVLNSEIWQGRVLSVEEDALILDVQSVQKPQNRLKIRVKKNIVEGDLDRISKRTGVRLSYKRIRNYQGVIENRFSVRLREPAEIPADILEKEFAAKMKRFSYMLNKPKADED